MWDWTEFWLTLAIGFLLGGMFYGLLIGTVRHAVCALFRGDRS